MASLMKPALKIIFGVTGCLFLAIAVGGTPLKAPKRMVQGQTVDLKPLFTWWKSRAGDQPLTAWSHITGKIVGTNGFGWIINAHVESSQKSLGEDDKPSGPFDGNIVLKNPPVSELAEFNIAHARLKALTESVKALTKRADAATEKVKELNAQDQSLRKRHARSRSVEQELKNWRATEKNEKTQLQAENKELAELKKKTQGPADGTYELDCFALQTREKNGSLPVYDHGTPVN